MVNSSYLVSPYIPAGRYPCDHSFQHRCCYSRISMNEDVILSLSKDSSVLQAAPAGRDALPMGAHPCPGKKESPRD